MAKMKPPGRLIALALIAGILFIAYPIWFFASGQDGSANASGRFGFTTQGGTAVIGLVFGVAMLGWALYQIARRRMSR